MRYSLVDLYAPFDTTFFPLPFTKASLRTGALNGSTGLVYTPNSAWQFNLNLSTGFRAPNIDDVGKIFDSEPGAVIVPNPELRPEYAWNLELGIRRIISNRVILELTGFTTLLSDALVRREYRLNGQDSILYDGEMSRVLAIQNAARARVSGLQANLEVMLPYGFGITSNFTFQNGWEELDEGGTAPLRHAVPWFGLTRLSYRYKRLIAELNVVYQSAIAYEDLPPSEQAKPHLYARDANGNPYTPGWATFNLKALYRISDMLSLSAGIENLADRRYRPFSSGISAPGINGIIALRLDF